MGKLYQVDLNSGHLANMQDRTAYWSMCRHVSEFFIDCFLQYNWHARFMFIGIAL